MARLLFNKAIKIFMVTFIFLFAHQNATQGEQNPASANKYLFHYDQEIPTLIRYGSIISGVMSKTGMFGFILSEDENSRSSFEFGYNVTGYELNKPPTINRTVCIFGIGYIPFLELVGLALTPFTYKEHQDEPDVGIGFISPIIGFSYLRNIYNYLSICFSVNTGPAYAPKFSLWKNRDNFNSYHDTELLDYDQYLEAYNAVSNISGKWGVRINPKIKLFILNFSNNSSHLGIGVGYVHYIFPNNHFNSYDIGLDFSMAW